MSKNCDVCNSKLGIMNNYKISNGNICLSCTQLCPSYKTETLDNMKQYWNINEKRKSIFNETQKLKNFASAVIHIDTINQLFYIGDSKKNTNYIVYSFNEIKNYEYDVIESKTTTQKKGGITRAVIGGAIAGPVGAVVGSSTAKSESVTKPGARILYINLNTFSGIKRIPMLNPPTGFHEFLDNCINSKSNTNDIVNTSEEIKKYKELLDQGLITEEEFSLKKKQILNI